jgi:SET domain-containing protein
MQSEDTPAPDRDFVRVASSGIAGPGLFAKRDIPRGTRIIEYTGERRTLESLVRDEVAGKRAGVYLAHVHHGLSIDGSRHGNDARFINHSCAPNCELYVFDDRLFIYAMRNIVEGEELTFDYQLTVAPGLEAADLPEEEMRCLCGADNCRGTMLKSESHTRSDA